MKTSRMLRYICVLFVSAMPFAAMSQTPAIEDSTRRETEVVVRGIQYDGTEFDEWDRPYSLLGGFSIAGDLVGAVMAAVSPYGQFEGAFRVNLKGRFFPTFEAGWGVSDHTDETTNLSYKTSAPFFRIGCDYNFAKHVRDKGRLFVGARYGITRFNYDYSGPDLSDPISGVSTPFHYEGMKGSFGWGELLFGLEAKIVGPLHLGWSVRYRLRLHQSYEIPGQGWYIPGYGKSGSSSFGATFHVIFDI